MPFKSHVTCPDIERKETEDERTSHTCYYASSSFCTSLLSVSEAYGLEKTRKKLGKDRTHDANSSQEIGVVFKLLPQVVVEGVALAKVEHEVPQRLQIAPTHLANGAAELRNAARLERPARAEAELEVFQGLQVANAAAKLRDVAQRTARACAALFGAIG